MVDGDAPTCAKPIFSNQRRFWQPCGYMRNNGRLAKRLDLCQRVARLFAGRNHQKPQQPPSTVETFGQFRRESSQFSRVRVVDLLEGGQALSDGRRQLFSTNFLVSDPGLVRHSLEALFVGFLCAILSENCLIVGARKLAVFTSVVQEGFDFSPPYRKKRFFSRDLKISLRSTSRTI